MPGCASVSARVAGPVRDVEFPRHFRGLPGVAAGERGNLDALDPGDCLQGV